MTIFGLKMKKKWVYKNFCDDGLTMTFFNKKLWDILTCENGKKMGVQFFVQKVRKVDFLWNFQKVRKLKSTLWSGVYNYNFFLFTTYIVWCFFLKITKCPIKALKKYNNYQTKYGNNFFFTKNLWCQKIAFMGHPIFRK